MLFESLSWVMLTLTLLVALPGALASPAPKAKKKSASTRITLETYPALEDGEIVVPRTTTVIAMEPQNLPKPMKTPKTAKKARSNKRVQTLGAPAPVDAPISAPAYVVNDGDSEPAAVAPTRRKFDTVPVEKRGQILKRMQICQSLFEESGRAYDYRSMTTAELQKELDAVRAGERPIATRDAGGVKPTTFVPVNVVPEGAESDPILDAPQD